jgi:hypothetical protein
VAAFENQDTLAGARQVRGVDQPVVTAADDDTVVLLTHVSEKLLKA